MYELLVNNAECRFSGIIELGTKTMLLLWNILHFHKTAVHYTVLSVTNNDNFASIDRQIFDHHFRK